MAEEMIAKVSVLINEAAQRRLVQSDDHNNKVRRLCPIPPTHPPTNIIVNFLSSNNLLVIICSLYLNN